MTKQNNQRKTKTTANKTAPKSSASYEPKNWKPLLVKFCVIVVVAVAAVCITDHKGYFLSDQANNHGERRWNALYDFTAHDSIDILIIGNSHAITGLNPKNISTALGCNCFVLGFSGTHIIDSYFCLKEALTICKPKLVVVETYPITNAEPLHTHGGDLSDQFKSFSVRRNVPIKLLSTPILFAPENYLPAWSSTIRNHEILFRNEKEFKANIEAAKHPRKNKAQGLYLGRYVRFQNGISDSITHLYDSLGAPVNGLDWGYSDMAASYTHRIIDLCKENGIAVAFLTVPMYHKHVAEYAERRKSLEALIPCEIPWIDMQMDYDTTLYTRDCFENTYNKNQHLTYYGSVLVSYVLANFIYDSINVSLPIRSDTQRWHELFYGEEGYFENYTPAPNDRNYKIICREKEINSLTVKDCILSKDGTLSIKISNNHLPKEARWAKATALARLKIDGRETMTTITLSATPQYMPPNHFIYFTRLNKNVDIIELMDIKLN